MAQLGAIDHPVIRIGTTSARLDAPDSSWRRIHNMVPTDAGGVRSVNLPIPYVTNAGVTPTEGTPSPTGGAITYGTCRSVFHGYVGDGSREILLLHMDEQIWEFIGWDVGWRILISVATASPILAQNLQDPLPSDFPTQWVRTPKGVVIIPQGGQACFYDGTTCLQLGYSDRPGPPIGLGPTSSSSKMLPDTAVAKLGVNDDGYAVDGLHADKDTGMPTVFRNGRLGTVVTINSPTAATGATSVTDIAGWLVPGRYRAKVQWLDAFGNLSPLSYPSNDVTFDHQPAMQLKLTDFTNFALAGPAFDLARCHLDHVKKQVAWASLQSGPTGTIARIVYRTKDTSGKGDTNYYELPADASVSTAAFATIPDNISHFLPDNIPDEWLYNIPEDVEPVPAFRIAELGFGRLFAANSRAEPGAIWVSDVGRYGTFLSRLKFYPDPEGAEITGLHRVADGLLCFTRNSTYLIYENQDGTGFRSQTLDSGKGCVAPSSIQTMPRLGKTIWLGRKGFYSWSRATGVVYEWDDNMEFAKRFNQGRLHKAVAAIDPQTGQYRCWVPMYAALENNLAWCFDERLGWSSRDDIGANGITTTDDYRGLMIGCGDVMVNGTARQGVWVLDRAGTPATGEIWTSWQRADRSEQRASTVKVMLQLRETLVSTTDATKLSIIVERDYRFGAVDDTKTVPLFPDEGVAYSGTSSTEPQGWDTPTWATATFRERRPFWVTVDIEVPNCEVWRLRMTSPAAFELMAISYEEMPRGKAASYR